MSQDSNQTYDTSNNQEMYFAAKPPEELASVCLARARSFFNIQESNMYLDLLRRNWSFFHGNFTDGPMTDSHSVTFGGDMGELVNVPVNHYRNIAEHMINMITSNRPTMEARAVNTDYKSLSQTYLANSILDYYMREKGLEDFIRDAVIMAVVLGCGFIRAEWNATAGDTFDADPETGEMANTGELEFTNLSPFDVVFDGTKSNWHKDSNDWILVRSFKNRFNLMAKYPEMADKIKGIAKETAAMSYRLNIFSNDDSDDIPVYEFYHKKSEALPNGRYFLFLSTDCPLMDIDLPYREIPIYRVSAGEYMGTPYGYTPMFDIFPLQELYNSTFSSIATNQAAFLVQNIFVMEDSNLDISNLQGALNVLTGRSKPEPIQLTATPKEAFDFLNIIEAKMEVISGVNSVARGDPQASLKSGTALALIQSMALQFISGLQNNYVRLIENVGTSIINILKDYAKTPKTVALVGINDRPLLQEFVGDDVNSIQRVIVSVGNPLAKSAAGRVQMAEQMLQMGLIQNPQQYFQVIETGSIKSLYESDMNTVFLIKHENEKMMAGTPCIVDPLDEHSIHILEHRSISANPDLRDNPELMANVQKHIMDHINALRTVDPDILAMIHQKPLMNPNMPMAPMQMPPDAGGPPPGPQGPAGPMPPKGHPNAKKSENSALLAPPGGIPQPGDLIKGQGSAGGQPMPHPATPPPPFNHPTQGMPQ